ncbi:hypothetical protein TNCV_1037261, partial [Trichonephila clavipes]
MTRTSSPQPLGGGCSAPSFRRGTTLQAYILPRLRGGELFVSSFTSRHYSAVRSCLVACGTMTTTSYRGRATVGVRILFPSRHYPAVRSRFGARKDDNDILPRTARRWVFVILFPSMALLCCPVASWCTRNDDKRHRIPRHAMVGVRQLFSVEALLYGLVASWCTRNDDNDIVLRTRGGGVRILFRGRAFCYSACRSSLGAWNDNNNSPTAAARRWWCSSGRWNYSAVRSRLGARGTMSNAILPRPRCGGCSSPFFRLGTTLLSHILPRPHGGGVRHLFPSRHYSRCPVVSCCTRND